MPARVSGREYVEPEHLLLGRMREDKALSAQEFIGTFTAVESSLFDVGNLVTQVARRNGRANGDMPRTHAVGESTNLVKC